MDRYKHTSKKRNNKLKQQISLKLIILQNQNNDDQIVKHEN